MKRVALVGLALLAVLAAAQAGAAKPGGVLAVVGRGSTGVLDSKARFGYADPASLKLIGVHSLLLLTAVEVFLAYERVEVHIMITILLGLSLIKSALIMSYFMHLRFERLGLFLILVPAMVFCICMMLIMFYPDSIRLMDMRPH